MNLQRRRLLGAALLRASRVVVLLLLLAACGILVSGCARMKQYSVESWQGPLPLSDRGLVQVDQSVR